MLETLSVTNHSDQNLVKSFGPPVASGQSRLGAALEASALWVEAASCCTYIFIYIYIYLLLVCVCHVHHFIMSRTLRIHFWTLKKQRKHQKSVIIWKGMFVKGDHLAVLRNKSLNLVIRYVGMSVSPLLQGSYASTVHWTLLA